MSGRDRLRPLYRDPTKIVLDKAIDHIDEQAGEFIGMSSLVVLATTDGTSTDASPRGGPPGFVRVLDRHRLAFGDLAGNNRLDSYANLLEHPSIGMLFVVPGLDETLRVNGEASVSTEPATLELCALDGRVPRAAVEIDVTECFLHCGAAFRRGAVWSPEDWATASERPSPGAILAAHADLDVEPTVIEDDLAAYYATAIWNVGGVDPA